MRFKSSFAFVAAMLLLSLSATTASAQTAQVSGKVSLRQADGTEAPLQGATVTFYRTDINGKFDVTTNRKGEYVRVGMPFGTYTIAVSAPNAQPTYLPDISIAQRPGNNFVLSPGNGRVLTLEEIKTAKANPPATAGGQPTTAANKISEAEAKRLAEEEARKIAEVEAKNARALSFNEKLPQINQLLQTAGKALDAKKYDEALTSYEQGVALDPSLGIFHRGKSIALRNRGIIQYNAGVKSKDKATQAAARADIKNAVEAAEQSVKAYQVTANEEGLSATDKQKAQGELLTGLADRAETYRIAMRIGLTEMAEQAAKAMQEYVNTETDAAKKAQVEVSLADALRDSGNVDGAVALYRRLLTANPNNTDAIYGLALTLSFDQTGANAAEVRDLMKEFIAKDKSPAESERKLVATQTISDMESFIKDKQTTPKPSNSRRRG